MPKHFCDVLLRAPPEVSEHCVLGTIKGCLNELQNAFFFFFFVIMQIEKDGSQKN